MLIVNTAMQDGNTHGTTSKMGYTASSRPRLQFGHESKSHFRFARTAFLPGHESGSRNSHDNRAMKQLHILSYISVAAEKPTSTSITNHSETWS